jgi:hypothetical protein
MSQKHPERFHDRAAQLRRRKKAEEKRAKKARRVGLRQARDKQ